VPQHRPYDNNDNEEANKIYAAIDKRMFKE
jgi:hypothetical protein